MDPDLKEDRREAREGHLAIFLTGLAFTALIVVAAISAIELLPVFKATTPTDQPVRSEQPDAG